MEIGLKISHKFIIDENIYDSFKTIFKDENILHIDEDYAKSKGFENKVMHGNILNGFLSYFVGELLPLKNVIIHKQDIAFHKPCYLNDIIFFDAVLNDKYESVGVFLFKYKFNKEGKTIAKGKIQIGLI